MWQIVSNIASIVTCFLFVLYIGGQIWKVVVTKNTRYEKFEIVPFEDDFDIEDHDDVLVVDEAGTAFSLSSTYGIKSIQIYKVVYEGEEDGSIRLISKTPKAAYKDLDRNETLYLRCDLGEFLPTTRIEVKRMDYSKVSFEPYISGKTGKIRVSRYRFQMTLRSFLYYLCV